MLINGPDHIRFLILYQPIKYQLLNMLNIKHDINHGQIPIYTFGR